MKRIIPVILGLSLISSCSLPGQEKIITENISTHSNRNVLMVGQEKGASITVKFDFTNSGIFAAKASSNGTPASSVTDIRSAKLYLSSSNTDPIDAANLKASSSALTFSGSTQTYTFGNVPPGTYYAAIELFSDAGGTTNIIEPVAYGGTTGTRGLTVSSNSATVNPTTYAYSFSDSTASFNIAPALLNAKGAGLEADITPTNGNTTPSGSITIN